MALGDSDRGSAQSPAQPSRRGMPALSDIRITQAKPMTTSDRHSSASRPMIQASCQRRWAELTRVTRTYPNQLVAEI